MRKNQNRKLRLEQVEEIKRLFEAGYTQGSIGRHFGVTAQTVGRIVRGESWAKESRSVLPSKAEQDATLERLLKLQEEVNAHGPREEEAAKPPRPRFDEIWDAHTQRTAVPPSPLDGGDAPSEGDGTGLQRVQEVAAKEGLDVELALKGERK